MVLYSPASASRLFNRFAHTAGPANFEGRPQQWLMYIRLSPRFDASFRRASEWARILSREVASQRRDAPDCFEERPQQWLLYIRLSPRFDAPVDGEQRTLD